MIQLEADGVRWDLNPEFEPELRRVLVAEGRAVKQSPAKLVTRVELDNEIFFVKRYRHAAIPLRPLKFFFKPSQGRREWALALKLEALGVPIVRHLALGERWSATGLKESILITEGFDGAPLDQYENVDGKRVIAFINAMHDRGVLQHDLHPGNILVHHSTGEMRLVDLHGTSIQPSISAEQRLRNLAFVRASVPIPVSPEVERLAVGIRRERLAYRSKRCLKHNREFAPKRLGGLTWWVRLPQWSEKLKNVLESPDEFFDRAEILKPGRSSTVGRADNLVLKRYNFRKVESLFKDLFRSSRAYRAYRKAYHLELLGIPTARPVAAAEHRVLRILLRSYFVMEEISGAKNLAQYLKTTPQTDDQLLRRVAELLARLHAEGFTHRDLKETNIVLDATGNPYVLDLEGLEFVGQITDARAASDLERFGRGMAKYPVVTRAARTVFLRAYCRARSLKRVPRI